MVFSFAAFNMSAPPKLRADDVRRDMRERSRVRDGRFDGVLKTLHRTILSRAATGADTIVWSVPSLVQGLPKYRVSDLVEQLLISLQEDGYAVAFAPPNRLGVSWSGNRTKYTLNEIKAVASLAGTTGTAGLAPFAKTNGRTGSSEHVPVTSPAHAPSPWGCPNDGKHAGSHLQRHPFAYASGRSSTNTQPFAGPTSSICRYATVGPLETPDQIEATRSLEVPVVSVASTDRLDRTGRLPDRRMFPNPPSKWPDRFEACPGSGNPGRNTRVQQRPPRNDTADACGLDGVRGVGGIPPAPKTRSEAGRRGGVVLTF